MKLAALTRWSTGKVAGLMILADAVVFSVGIPLERQALIAAADRSSSAMLIFGFLAANIALLLVAIVGISATSILLSRLAKRFLNVAVRVERGEIELRRDRQAGR